MKVKAIKGGFGLVMNKIDIEIKHPMSLENRNTKRSHYGHTSPILQ